MILPEFNSARVLVVGDVMLDRYWFGEVTRISPEAPVPVVHIQSTEERPGGAANVARGAAALGAQATMLAVVGEDDAGNQLEALLQKSNVKTINQIDDWHFEMQTTLKSLLKSTWERTAWSLFIISTFFLLLEE